MIVNSNLFSSYKPCARNKKVKIDDDSLSLVAGVGDIKIPLPPVDYPSTCGILVNAE